MKYHSIDIEWGNHDIVWMGAACGNPACIMNVIRISARYGNLFTLEEGYGINIRTMTEFAKETYKENVPEIFHSHTEEFEKDLDIELMGKMEKAAAIMQFKLEAEIIKRHPEYEMNDRLLLDKIDYEKGTITIEGKTYKLLDTNFPTIDPNDPYALTEAEAELMESLCSSFKHSEKLQKHIRFIYSKGSMYLVINNNLLYHGCIPMTPDGEFAEYEIDGEKVKGKKLLDRAEQVARVGYFGTEGQPEKIYGEDFLWYLWCGIGSPVYGKNKMTSFERYFIAEEETWEEIKDPYYHHVEKVSVCCKILREFGISPDSFSHIINGHVPVKIKDGESPIKGEGKLFVIDGGISKAYQKTTGIAGYTFIYNSWLMALAEHKPYMPLQPNGKQTFVAPRIFIVDKLDKRILVRDTDQAEELQAQVNELKDLIEAYRKGLIKEDTSQQ